MEQVKNSFHTLKKLSVKDWFLLFIGIAIATGLFLLIGTNNIFFQFTILLFNSWLTIFVFLLYKRLNLFIKEQASQTKENETTFRPVADDDVEKTMQYKEKELTQIELDKTIIFEELLSKTDLKEAEKQAYRKKISDKELEAKSIQQDLALLKTRIQKVVKDSANFLLKRDPSLEKVIELLSADFIIHRSFDEINEKLNEVHSELPQNVIEDLKKAHMMTDQYALTRIGYRELTKAAKKGRVSLLK
ncbi:hypothetical protein [Bacillus sp. FJAT-47783]|uniref:hypothetical protein n=1 Tax=Bacillus sp. FJAT-47783 TaxID=2922712 RepID=UPI001FAC4EF1|nr:hypothetical protein [Bacillus sp. FJAT-47783]